jgi:hypothetical protein
VIASVLVETMSPWESYNHSHWNRDHPGEAWLGRAFLRGRIVIQALSYGHTYWEGEVGLTNLVDPQTESDPGTRVVAHRLLQLVNLSRTGVYPFDQTWNLPTPLDVRQTTQQMRTELGIHGNTKPPSQFPGITLEHIMDSIVTGQLRMGNIDQPDVVCWQG